MNTPVLFLVFNRPEVTSMVFEMIRQAQPERLYVAADGPRSDRKEETEVCRRVREIATAADWNCDVKTLFRDQNLGCRRAVSEAITWFFENEESGIILEDDCLPSRSFFPFCQELLDRFKDNERIVVISGVNFQFGSGKSDFSYYFSRYNHCWGWATWRRAWELYDGEMSQWPAIKDSGYLLEYLGRLPLFQYWAAAFDIAATGSVDSWAYRWTLSCWVNNGLAVLPGINLVSNIGFDKEGSTHTRGKSLLADVPALEMEFPLQHPTSVVRDEQADRRTDRLCYDQRLHIRVWNRFRRFVKQWRG